MESDVQRLGAAEYWERRVARRSDRDKVPVKNPVEIGHPICFRDFNRGDIRTGHGPGVRNRIRTIRRTTKSGGGGFGRVITTHRLLAAFIMVISIPGRVHWRSGKNTAYDRQDQKD